MIRICFYKTVCVSWSNLFTLLFCVCDCVCVCVFVCVGVCVFVCVLGLLIEMQYHDRLINAIKVIPISHKTKSQMLNLNSRELHQVYNCTHCGPFSGNKRIIVKAKQWGKSKALLTSQKIKHWEWERETDILRERERERSRFSLCTSFCNASPICVD